MDKNEQDDYDLSKLRTINLKGSEVVFRSRSTHYGIPLFVFRTVNGDASEKKDWEKYGFAPSPEKRSFAVKDVIGRKMVDIPVGLSFVRRGKFDVLVGNCFNCHAGPTDGVMVLGAPNRYLNSEAVNQLYQESIAGLDPDSLKYKLAKFQWSLRKSGEPPTEEMKKEYDNYLAGLRNFLQTVLAKNRKGLTGTGTYAGHYFAYRAATRMENPEKSLRRSTKLAYTDDEFKYFGKLDHLPPVKPLPLWNWNVKTKLASSEKGGLYWTHDAGALPIDHLTFENTGDNSPDVDKNWDDYIKESHKIVEYLSTIKPPKFQGAIDEKAADRGYKIFHNRCSRCHGKYKLTGEILSFPNHPPRNVGTDPEYAKTIAKIRPAIKRFYQSDRVKEPLELKRGRSGGYSPPPLTGVSMNAPYFHNGSVPTLHGVLDAKSRPTYWELDRNPFRYDREKVGISLIGKQKSDSLRLYDTTKPGYGNQGHEFGDDLSPADRKDLIEYLKRL